MGKTRHKGEDWEFRVWPREGDNYVGQKSSASKFVQCHRHGDRLSSSSWRAGVDERAEWEAVKDASGRHSHGKTMQ